MFPAEWREFPSAPCLAGKKIDDNLRLDVVEIARYPDMLSSLFPSWSGGGLIGTAVIYLFVIMCKVYIHPPPDCFYADRLVRSYKENSNFTHILNRGNDSEVCVVPLTLSQFAVLRTACLSTQFSQFKSKI